MNNKLEWVLAYLPEVRMNIQCVSGSKKARLYDVVDNAIRLLKEQDVRIKELEQKLDIKEKL